MYFLGVDGGGTKTALALIDGSGRVLSEVVTANCYYPEIGFETFRTVLEAGLEQIAATAAVNPEEIGGSFWGVPCYDEDPENIPYIHEIISGIVDNRPHGVGNDVEVSWAGALGCQPGISLVCGTGAIGFGRDSRGDTARASGWGEVCGDEGSAYWLGRRLLQLFAKQSDGRMPRGMLHRLVRQRFELEEDFDIIFAVAAKLDTRDKMAELARLLFEAAQAGDPSAVQAYADSAYEQSLTVRALLERLQFAPGKPVNVSYTGGVFAAGSLILKPLAAFLADTHAVLQPPLLRPAVGAALYALQLFGGGLTPVIVASARKSAEELERG